MIISEFFFREMKNIFYEYKFNTKPLAIFLTQ